MNASRTVAFASLAPVAAAQDAPAAARPPWPDAPGEPVADDDPIRTGLRAAKAAVTPCFSAAPRSRHYQEIKDAWPRPRHPARRPRHHLGLRPTRYPRSAGSSPRSLRSGRPAPHRYLAPPVLDAEADGRPATVRPPGPGHRHHLDRHRHTQDRAPLTPPTTPRGRGLTSALTSR
jgi:hypothetical protein